MSSIGQHIPYQLGRRLGEQGPRPLLGNQDRVEKLATGTRRIKGTRKLVDCEVAPGKFKTAKNLFTVGTWNVQTLWAPGKLELLRHEMKNFAFDVLGVSEVRWTGKGELATGDFVWSGEEKYHCRGVGFLLSRKAQKCLISYNPFSPRIISARFSGTPFNITIMQVYAPTVDASDEDIESFYEEMEGVLLKIPKKDFVIVVGDWNAKIGSDNTGWETAMGGEGYGDRNERGERLLEFATEHNLYICNSRFKQRPCRKWTWASPDGIHHNMIDLVLVQSKWKTSVRNCRTFQSADIQSDHSLVLCNIKIRLRNQQKVRQDSLGLRKYNINDLKQLRTKQVYEKNLNEQLKKITPMMSLDEHAVTLESAIREAIELSLTVTEKPRKPWITGNTLKVVDEKREWKLRRHVCTENNNIYRAYCIRVKKLVREDKENWLNEQCAAIEGDLKIGKIHQAYRLIKMLRRPFTSRLRILRDDAGNVLQTKTAIMNQWTGYCSMLYNGMSNDNLQAIDIELEEIIPPTDYCSCPHILYSEVEAAVGKLKQWKSPGFDGVTTEMIKAGGSKLIMSLYELCQKIWFKEKIPANWGKTILIPIPKKGDLTKCENYRTISLIGHLEKVFLLILLRRLQYQLEPHLAEEQAGFRRDRSTIQQILLVRLLAEKAKRKGKNIYNCFIDFQKAFDSINQQRAWKILASFGVDGKIINILQDIYENIRLAVRAGNDIGAWFKMLIGSRQGDPLSPLLFIAYLERTMDSVTKLDLGVAIQGSIVSNIRFADDVNLMNEDFQALQAQAATLQMSAKKGGLRININKTKTMVFGARSIEHQIELDGQIVENVEQFEYLGSIITWDNDCSVEIKSRIAKATGALASLKHIWRSGKITISTKLRILSVCVFSVLLYAAEAWTLRERDRKKLLAFEMRCYRRLLGIKWQDKISNIRIRTILSIHTTIIDLIRQRKLMLFGHICRMDNSRIIKHVVTSVMGGKNKQGRPSRTWLEDITDWCECSIQEAFHRAQNRDIWKKTIGIRD